jgi:hypothetical protein
VAAAALVVPATLAATTAPAGADVANSAVFTSKATFVEVARIMVNVTIAATGDPGTPAPTLTPTGLPAWLHFATSSKHPGTAHLSGNPPDGVIGAVSFTVSATNGSGPATEQVVTLDILGFQTAAGGTFTVGQPGSWTVAVPDSLSAAGVALTTPRVPPHLAGLTFVDNGDGTATLSGTPLPGDRTSKLHVQAGLGSRATARNFVITVAG